MNKKRFFLLDLLILATVGTYAQSSVVATGGDLSDAQGNSVGVTVGQPAMETFTASSGSVLLGIQQDFSDVEYAIATKPIPNIIVENVKEPEVIDLREYFIGSERFSYSVTSSDNSIARPIISKTMLLFEIGDVGSVRIIVVAITPQGQRYPASFTVTVEESIPVTDATKEHLIVLYGNACTLLNMEYDRTNEQINAEHEILSDLAEQAKSMLLNNSATNKEVELLNSQLEQSMSSYIRLMQPTTIHDVLDNVKIMVKGRTIYISNVHERPVAIYDITGKRIYICRNAESIETMVKTVGTYIVMVGEFRQSVVIK